MFYIYIRQFGVRKLVRAQFWGSGVGLGWGTSVQLLWLRFPGFWALRQNWGVEGIRDWGLALNYGDEGLGVGEL